MANVSFMVNSSSAEPGFNWSRAANGSFPEELEFNVFKELMGHLNVYLTPIIVFVGIFTNVLSLLVFTTTHLRFQSSR